MVTKSGLSVAIMSAVFVSQLIMQTDAQTGAATTRPITFDCDPEQLQGAAKVTCLARRFEEGRRLFDEETFQGNGRTCVTCHSVRTGTFSPEDAQQRLAANPSDPLFVGDGLDDGVFGTSRITEHATVRIEIPLPPRVKLVDDPSATSVTLIRGTPTTRDTPSLQPVFMYDGRDLTLEAQALGAVHAHTQTGFEPTPLQLELIAEFQRTAPRFFSSLQLFLFARGGPPPLLPNGVTASEKRGRAMFDDVPITPGSTRGLCAMCHSGPMLDVSNEFNIFLPDLPGLRFFGVGVSERNPLNLPTSRVHRRRHRQDRHARSRCVSDGSARSQRVPAGALWSRRALSACHRVQPVQDAVALGREAHRALLPRQLVEDARRSRRAVHVHVQALRRHHTHATG